VEAEEGGKRDRGIFLIIASDDDDHCRRLDVANYDTLHSRIASCAISCRASHIERLRESEAASLSSIIGRFLISGIAETRECNRENEAARLESSKRSGERQGAVCSAANGELCVSWTALFCCRILESTLNFFFHVSSLEDSKLFMLLTRIRLRLFITWTRRASLDSNKRRFKSNPINCGNDLACARGISCSQAFLEISSTRFHVDPRYYINVSSAIDRMPWAIANRDISVVILHVKVISLSNRSVNSPSLSKRGIISRIRGN